MYLFVRIDRRFHLQLQDVNCYAGFGGSAAAGKDFMGMLPLEDCLKATPIGL